MVLGKLKQPIFIAATILYAVVCFHTNAYAMSVVRDAEAEHVIADIATPIFKAAGIYHQNIKVRLILDPTPNAFVMDGRHIFMHTGLLSIAPTPEALAGVIAHECGHIASSHFTLQRAQYESMQHLSALGAVLGVAIGVASGNPMAGIGATLGVHDALFKNMLAYTRAHESAADEAAVHYMKKAGLSLDGVIQFWRLLQQEERLSGDRPEAYWSSHPPARERLELLQRSQSHHHGGLLPTNLRQRYWMMVAKLDGYTKSLAEVQSKYPGSGLIEEYAKAVALYRKGYIDKALQSVQQLISTDANNKYLYELQAQILYENGRISESIKPYQRAVDLMPQEPLLQVELAVALLGWNDIKADTQVLKLAQSLLSSSLDIEPNNAYAWQQLGIVLSRQQDNLGYQLALAQSHIVVGDFASARRALAGALEINKSTSKGVGHQAWLNEVQEALRDKAQ